MRKKTIPESKKIDSIVDRLANEPKGNTIRTTAGFMVVAKDGEHDEELPEDQIKLKKRKLSDTAVTRINEYFPVTMQNRF